MTPINDNTTGEPVSPVAIGRADGHLAVATACIAALADDPKAAPGLLRCASKHLADAAACLALERERLRAHR